MQNVQDVISYKAMIHIVEYETQLERYEYNDVKTKHHTARNWSITLIGASYYNVLTI